MAHRHAYCQFAMACVMHVMHIFPVQIISIDSASTRTKHAFADAVAATHVGTPTSVTLVRADTQHTLDVHVASRELTYAQMSALRAQLATIETGLVAIHTSANKRVRSMRVSDRVTQQQAKHVERQAALRQKVAKKQQEMMSKLVGTGKKRNIDDTTASFEPAACQVLTLAHVDVTSDEIALDIPSPTSVHAAEHTHRTHMHDRPALTPQPVLDDVELRTVYPDRKLEHETSFAIQVDAMSRVASPAPATDSPDHDMIQTQTHEQASTSDDIDPDQRALKLRIRMRMGDDTPETAPETVVADAVSVSHTADVNEDIVASAPTSARVADEAVPPTAASPRVADSALTKPSTPVTSSSAAPVTSASASLPTSDVSSTSASSLSHATSTPAVATSPPVHDSLSSLSPPNTHS